MKKIFLLFALAGMFASCMNPNGGNSKKIADNKAGVQRFYDEVINAHNPAMVDSFCTAEFTDHNPEQGHSGKGLDDIKAEFKEWFASMPDVHITTNMMIAEGDTVMALITMTGTNSGRMNGMPATNKKVTVEGMDLIVLKNGKATDRWGQFDMMAYMTQLGMMPEHHAMADSSKMMKEKKM